MPDDPAYMGFSHHACPFYPCHQGIKRTFNCLFCYCPLIVYECPGPYRIIIDRRGHRQKDCSICRLPHEGYRPAWQFIQRWLRQPVFWQGQPFKPHRSLPSQVHF